MKVIIPGILGVDINYFSGILQNVSGIDSLLPKSAYRQRWLIAETLQKEGHPVWSPPVRSPILLGWSRIMCKWCRS